MEMYGWMGLKVLGAHVVRWHRWACNCNREWHLRWMRLTPKHLSSGSNPSSSALACTVARLGAYSLLFDMNEKKDHVMKRPPSWTIRLVLPESSHTLHRRINMSERQCGNPHNRRHLTGKSEAWLVKHIIFMYWCIVNCQGTTIR